MRSNGGIATFLWLALTLPTKQIVNWIQKRRGMAGWLAALIIIIIIIIGSAVIYILLTPSGIVTTTVPLS